MRGKEEKIGLLGGSFDPVHNGHLALAEQAADFAGLDRVLFIPTANPPHKTDRELSSFQDRLEMVKLATAGDPRFEISLFEKKDRVVYTFESVEYFRERGYTRRQLHYLMGGDSLGEISEWKNPEVIFSHATIIALSRPGYGGVSPFPADAAVIIINRGRSGISSTRIREVVRSGGSIEGMVPEPVADFISENSLYRKDRSL